MAKQEGRIEKAALVIIQKAITRAGARETSVKSPEEKVGFRLAEADLNSSCHTYDRKELHSKYFPKQINWFGRRQ